MCIQFLAFFVEYNGIRFLQIAVQMNDLFLLFLRMFARKKKNRSCTVTIVVADKSYGRFQEVHNFGTFSDAHEIEKLEMGARKWITTYVEQPALDLWPEERLLP